MSECGVLHIFGTFFYASRSYYAEQRREHTFKKLKSHERANLHNTKVMKTFYEKDTELN